MGEREPGAARQEVNIPSETIAVVGEFADRPTSDKAIEALIKQGFKNEQIGFVARGADNVDGKFVPGVLLVTVHGEGRNDLAARILRQTGARSVREGTISATGDVIEESAAQEEAGAET